MTDGRAGIENQALGLAEAIHAERSSAILSTKRFDLAAPWRAAPARVVTAAGDPFKRLAPGSDMLAAPWPDIWIGCGRASVPLSMAARARNEGPGLVVQLQNPRVSAKHFDLVIAPDHDRLSGQNVISILGATHRIRRADAIADAEKLGPYIAHLPRPHIAVLIGGATKRAKLSGPTVFRWIDALHALTEADAGLMITTSRRTGAAAEARIRTALEGRPALFWDGGPLGDLDNPYRAFLGAADHILVTSDSVNMATEAAAMGKPVHFLEGPDPSPKLQRFRDSLIERGFARPLDLPLQSWKPSPLDETRRAARAVLQVWDARRHT